MRQRRTIRKGANLFMKFVISVARNSKTQKCTLPGG